MGGFTVHGNVALATTWSLHPTGKAHQTYFFREWGSRSWAYRGARRRLSMRTGTGGSTEIAGRQVKQELRVGDRWLELLKRDGRTGVVLDGQFMSGADARKTVDATAGSVQ